ncbi:hypothetical protein H6G54_25150 [Anabaena cylindrica FACHB-243]|nr:MULTISPECIES: hypothetical protein [Anabaena]MBD2420926.1 hypothetical protein [Anabaena cylindrica FACHB-243]MBY5283474.1 hypothetical protein [Anabaena sp. CCAP 1446/1C]MBY5307001.1 hypothetical protein [Anabaena sp. CCAP 1446/1C]MCM2405679.1 hypothetical protein [Anabaena sp. CCAP 1446/1C]
MSDRTNPISAIALIAVKEVQKRKLSDRLPMRSQLIPVNEAQENGF